MEEILYISQVSAALLTLRPPPPPLSDTQFQFKCALLAWQKLYTCIAKAIAAGLLTSSAHNRNKKKYNNSNKTNI